MLSREISTYFNCRLLYFLSGLKYAIFFFFLRSYNTYNIVSVLGTPLLKCIDSTVKWRGVNFIQLFFSFWKWLCKLVGMKKMQFQYPLPSVQIQSVLLPQVCFSNHNYLIHDQDLENNGGLPVGVSRKKEPE